MRYQVLCEELGELPRNTAALERDAWDDCSLHVHASVESRLVAYVRVILPGLQPFLMESLGYRLDTLPVELRNRVAEPSRMLVDPKLERGLRVEYDLFGKVLAAAHRLSIERGIVGWVFDTDALIERSLRQRGWPIVPVGEAIEHHGAIRTAFVVELAQLHPAQFARRVRRLRPESVSLS